LQQAVFFKFLHCPYDPLTWGSASKPLLFLGCPPTLAGDRFCLGLECFPPLLFRLAATPNPPPPWIVFCRSLFFENSFVETPARGSAQCPPFLPNPPSLFFYIVVPQLWSMVTLAPPPPPSPPWNPPRSKFSPIRERTLLSVSFVEAVPWPRAT